MDAICFNGVRVPDALVARMHAAKAARQQQPAQRVAPRRPRKQAPCPACDGRGELMGSLGRAAHYRCRDCGWTFNR